jgi:hypothetical protein
VERVLRDAGNGVAVASRADRQEVDLLTQEAGTSVDVGGYRPGDVAFGSGESLVGHRRIHGELLGLGYRVGVTIVWRILHRAGVDPAPHRVNDSWITFLQAQTAPVFACDFFTLDTVSCQRIYFFFVVEGRQPPRPYPGRHPPSDRCVGRPAGSKFADGPW